MAIIKIIPSKGSLKKIIDYVLNKEKTDEKIISGKDCLPESSVETMNATKSLYNKTDGRSYYHIIQSFKPGEVSPEGAHEIGKELAEKQFKGHEVVIATHVDKEHIHNHFVVNSVSFEDGRKLYSSEQYLRELKRESNRICKDKGLAVIEKQDAHNRYSMVEYKLAEKGMSLWKEQLRAAIDEAKEHSGTIVEMKNYLEDNFNIKMKIQDKNLSFLHPEKQKYCRGKKLGNAYTKEEVMGYFEKSPEMRDIDNKRVPGDREVNTGRLGVNKTTAGLNKVGFGIEGIVKKVARDIEKEKIRVDKTKTLKDLAKEKEKAKEKYMGRDRDRGRERER